jgi:hypothetical protein
MKINSSSWQQWTRNGRLATVALVIVFTAWLGFQIFADPIARPPILDQLLYTIAGIWMGNIALAQGKKEQDIEKRIDELGSNNHAD